MTWFIVARVVFVLAIVSTAVVIRPLDGGLGPNGALGLVLAALAVVF